VNHVNDSVRGEPLKICNGKDVHLSVEEVIQCDRMGICPTDTAILQALTKDQVPKGRVGDSELVMECTEESMDTTEDSIRSEDLDRLDSKLDHDTANNAAGLHVIRKGHDRGPKDIAARALTREGIVLVLVTLGLLIDQLTHSCDSLGQINDNLVRHDSLFLCVKMIRLDQAKHAL
jgi:hypothetical protein